MSTTLITTNSYSVYWTLYCCFSPFHGRTFLFVASFARLHFSDTENVALCTTTTRQRSQNYHPSESARALGTQIERSNVRNVRNPWFRVYSARTVRAYRWNAGEVKLADARSKLPGSAAIARRTRKSVRGQRERAKMALSLLLSCVRYAKGRARAREGDGAQANERTNQRARCSNNTKGNVAHRSQLLSRTEGVRASVREQHTKKYKRWRVRLPAHTVLQHAGRSWRKEHTYSKDTDKGWHTNGTQAEEGEHARTFRLGIGTQSHTAHRTEPNRGGKYRTPHG